MCNEIRYSMTSAREEYGQNSRQKYLESRKSPPTLLTNGWPVNFDYDSPDFQMVHVTASLGPANFNGAFAIAVPSYIQDPLSLELIRKEGRTKGEKAKRRRGEIG